MKDVDIVSLKGGIDLGSTALKIPPGAALDLVNFEPELEGGYRRISGYERGDGRASPSAAVYYTIGVDDGSGINVGDTLTGGTSSATSYVHIKDGNTLGVTALSGTYTLSEAANGTTITAIEALSGRGAAATDDIWQLSAEDYYRGLIGAVPGSGDVLGAIPYGANWYAFRWDGSAVKMYVSSSAGWTEVAMFSYIFFDGGVLADGDIEEGTVITGPSATATVKKFIKNAGGYGVDASGYMVLDVTSGSFADNDAIQVSAVTKCKADGVDTAIALSNNSGRFQFTQHNFYGSTATRYLYGCDGKNFAWEFDGTVLTPVFYPAPTKSPSWNAPTYITVHRQHLFLAHETGQVAHSSPGTPLIFSGLLDAGEFGLGDTPTGMYSRAGEVLALYTRNKTYGLYGYGASDWILKVISETSGAKPYTVQGIGKVYALDDKGVTPLDRVEHYGDFESATVSRLVAPLLEASKSLVVGSIAAKERNQYRLFFSNGDGLIMGDDRYLGDSLPAFTQIRFPDIPVCIDSAEDAASNEVILFGDSSGYVYQMEKGYNFDGKAIEFVYRSPFLHQKKPHQAKSYRKLFIDVDADKSFSMDVTFELSFGRSAAGGQVQSSDFKGGGNYWDAPTASWDEIYWDSEVFSSQGLSLAGTGNNISLLFYGNSKYIRPFTLETIEIHYFNRRLKSGK